MNDPNPPTSDALTPQPAQSPTAPIRPGGQGGDQEASGWVKQVEPSSALTYPPPPGSTRGAEEPASVPLQNPPAPTNAPATNALAYPQAPQAPQPGVQPQVVHNTVVQNHYHTGGAQLVRTSSRDRTIAVLLAFFLGAFGVHRYYLGRSGSATVMLVMSLTGVLLPIVSIWALVDMVSLLATSRERFELRYNCSIAPGALPPGAY